MRFRFVGIESEIGGYPLFDRYGQEVELPEGMEAEAAAALLLPEEQFLEIFDGIDTESYLMVACHDDAPAEFQRCKRAANIAVAEFRQKTKGGR